MTVCSLYIQHFETKHLFYGCIVFKLIGNGGVKAPSLLEKVKEEVEAIFHQEKSPHHHHKETHGKSDNIDENTPIDEVKGPSILERAKEEIEALVQSSNHSSEERIRKRIRQFNIFTEEGKRVRSFNCKRIGKSMFAG